MLLVTFSEFKRDTLSHLVWPEKKAIWKNFTMQEHAGHGDELYEAQCGFEVVQYMLDKTWKVHFNGVTGYGATLDSAIKDLAIKSR